MQTQIKPRDNNGLDDFALNFGPFVIFGVPLFLALKDKMFGPPVKPGGYTESLQFFVLVGCSLGLITTVIVLVLTRNK